MKKIIFTLTLLLVSIISKTYATNDYHNPYTLDNVVNSGDVITSNNDNILNIINYISDRQRNFQNIYSIDIYRFNDNNINKSQKFLLNRYYKNKKYFHMIKIKSDNNDYITVRYFSNKSKITEVLLFIKDKSDNPILFHIKCDIPLNNMMATN